jgi:hypothetical protein
MAGALLACLIRCIYSSSRSGAVSSPGTSCDIKVPIFGEKQKLTDLDFGFHHDFLIGIVLHIFSMKTVSQGFSRELRSQKYNCAFCDSVWKRLQEGSVNADLESLYLEHMKKYHGMTV